MTPENVGFLCLGLVLVLVLCGMPVAFVVATSAMIGFTFVAGFARLDVVAGGMPYSVASTYGYTAIPMFLLLGNLLAETGFAEDLFFAARQWLGRIRLGLAHAVIWGCAVFGACSGTAMATVAVFTKMAVPVMERLGYNRRFTFGCIAAAATLDVMIPPNVLMIIYGIMNELPVGPLLMACFLPGIVAAAMYMIGVYVYGLVVPGLGPRLTEQISWADRFRSLKGTWSVITLIVLVLGGIYTGIFTPTEAGALGATGAAVLGVASRRLSLKGTWAALVESARSSGMLLLLLVFAFILGYFLTISRLPSHLTQLIAEWHVHRYVILTLFMVTYIILGSFLDIFSTLVITMPIVVPVIDSLGFNLIWWGVVTVHLCEMGMVTPPFGLNLFTIKAVMPEVPFSEITGGIWPFFAMQVAILIVYVAFPQIALFVPETLMHTRIG